jgi:DNA polymerase-3 subunit beta
VVTVEVSDAKIRVAIGMVLTSKLIDGTFPDYQRVIPTGNDKRNARRQQSDFAASVDRVSTISSERGRAVKLAMADGQHDALGQQSGFRQRDRRDRRSTMIRARSISASTPSICWTSPRSSMATPPCFKLADAGSPTLIQDTPKTMRSMC